jgi:hypothetical protein
MHSCSTHECTREYVYSCTTITNFSTATPVRPYRRKHTRVHTSFSIDISRVDLDLLLRDSSTSARGSRNGAGAWRGTIDVRLEYGQYWRQQLSVTIICGRVMVVAAVVARERLRGGNGETPEEISTHSLQP